MTKIKSLTIAIPLYNEEKSILNLHERLTNLLKTINLEIVKVLLVDDGSIDDTNKLLNKFFDKKETFKIIHINCIEHVLDSLCFRYDDNCYADKS